VKRVVQVKLVQRGKQSSACHGREPPGVQEDRGRGSSHQTRHCHSGSDGHPRRGYSSASPNGPQSTPGRSPSSASFRLPSRGRSCHAPGGPGAFLAGMLHRPL